NRSCLLPDRRLVLGDREYITAVKGCGAAMDAFENVPLNAVRARAICRDPRLAEALATEDGSGLITGERWFGNTPYGGQAPDNAMIGLLASLRADQAQIAGFQVCPVVSLVRWLDKDAVVAADGTMHFADLEGIEDAVAGKPAAVRETIERQFHRHVYEASYALEALAVEVERRWRGFRGPSDRRRWILEVLQRACVADPFLSIEPSGNRLVLHIEPAVDAAACRVDIELASEVES